MPVIFAIALLPAAVVVGTAEPGYAASCGSASPPAGGTIDGTPWAQRRYAMDRLAGIANGTGVTVAVIDSGVDARQPRLHGAVLTGADELEPPGNGQVDCVGHGTAVASIIAGAPVEGTSFAGLAPGSRVLPVRVTERETIDGRATGRAGTASGVARAIRYAAGHGAKVINLSLTLYRDDPDVRGAVADALRRDIVIVAATGNVHRVPGPDPAPYPAAYPGVLGVGAIGPDGTRVDTSPVGRFVAVTAPGARVVAAVPGNGLSTFDGTSFAAPFVTATAALIRQRFPLMPAASVVDRIEATTDPAPAGAGTDGYGHGVLNPIRAVTELVAPPFETRRPASPVSVNGMGSASRTAGWSRAPLIAACGVALAGLALLLALAFSRAAMRGKGHAPR